MKRPELAMLFQLRLEVIHGTLLSYIDTLDEKEISPEAACELECAMHHINEAICYLDKEL
jgi:hypothetical protein